MLMVSYRWDESLKAGLTHYKAAQFRPNPGFFYVAWNMYSIRLSPTLEKGRIWCKILIHPAPLGILNEGGILPSAWRFTLNCTWRGRTWTNRLIWAAYNYFQKYSKVSFCMHYIINEKLYFWVLLEIAVGSSYISQHAQAYDDRHWYKLFLLRV